MGVKCVENGLHRKLTWLDTQECTQERNHSSVMCVILHLKKMIT